MTHLPNLPQINLVAMKPKLVSITELLAHPRSARRHPAKQIEKIASNIRAYGFVLPIAVGTHGQVLAGAARLDAARQLGMDKVPVVSLAHLSAEDQRAFMLADNKLAELSSWDENALKIELRDLAPLELKVPLLDLGFSTAEIDVALSLSFGGEGQGALTPDPERKAVSRVGDVWLLGDHRLVCGDCTEYETHSALMAFDDEARMIFTDPPYNCPIDGFVSGRNTGRREFPMATGEMTREEFTDFLVEGLDPAGLFLVDGGIAYVCMDWRHMREVEEAGRDAIGPLKNVCVWAKPNAGMGAFYRSQHEMVFVFKKGEAAHVNNFGLGEVRYRTNLWQYPGASGFHADREGDLEMHPTTKPVNMIADAILDVSHRGDIVMDMFAGSGATLMACMKTGRVARLIELDPLYVDLIIRRFQAAGGGEVYLQDGGASFDEVALQRTGKQDGGAEVKLLEGPQ